MKELKNRSGEEFTESVPINVFMQLFSMLMDIVKAILMALPVLVVTVIRIFIPPKPKDVSGQTALVAEYFANLQ